MRSFILVSTAIATAALALPVDTASQPTQAYVDQAAEQYQARHQTERFACARGGTFGGGDRASQYGVVSAGTVHHISCRAFDKAEGFFTAHDSFYHIEGPHEVQDDTFLFKPLELTGEV
ncbi:hypothetical protein IWQ60_009824 [Tieghemiomyces parasiticus]|uniref:Uncharacterized protein n=1 Tax=Tieghemiomyces parasiticus TaxID=78921 RepID=A0A9W7ZSG0_9FUNG|nr:hypothetical protein IWQ60_009824 [Tieghemiomyces parasiticus]